MKLESAILKRLGPIPFWRGEKKCLAELDRIYRRAAEALHDSSHSDFLCTAKFPSPVGASPALNA